MFTQNYSIFAKRRWTTERLARTIVDAPWFRITSCDLIESNSKNVLEGRCRWDILLQSSRKQKVSFPKRLKSLRRIVDWSEHVGVHPISTGRYLTRRPTYNVRRGLFWHWAIPVWQKDVRVSKLIVVNSCEIRFFPLTADKRVLPPICWRGGRGTHSTFLVQYLSNVTKVTLLRNSMWHPR
jgi:hypothetical protein